MAACREFESEPNATERPGPNNFATGATAQWLHLGVEMTTTLRFSMATAGLYCSLTAVPVMAIEFKTDSFEGSFNSTIGVAAGMRLRDPSCGLVGDKGYCASANTEQWSAADDGNLNYRKGDFFTLAVKGSHELLLKNGDGLKFFARGVWKLDPGADNTERTELSSEARKQIVHNIEILDFWASKDLTLGGQNARLRVGNQVISWGEALFYVGGVSTNVLDFQKLLVPGTQLKEAFLPVPAVSLSGSLSDTVNAEAYYQFQWKRTRVAPVGAYFSASDIYNKGRVPVSFSGANFNVTGQDAYAVTGLRRMSEADQIAAINGNGDFGVPVLADQTPGNSGQYGVSFKWAPEGTTINLGAYAANYHDTFPVLSVANGGTAYQWKFLEDRKVYGLSANFPLGNWAIGVEYSYRPKDAVSLSGCFTPGTAYDANLNTALFDCPLYADRKKHQVSVTGMYQLQKSENPLILGALRADSGFLTAEAAFTRYPGLSKPIVRTIGGVQVEQVAAAGYFIPLDRSGAYPIATRIGSASSWGYTVDFNWTYDSTVIQGWQLTPGITFGHAVKGDTPNYAAQFLEGNKSANFYVLFNQNPTKWQAGVNLTKYFGGKNDIVQRQYLADRDFVGGFVNYNF